MKIRVIVAGDQIVSRGRLICRLQGCTHAENWRRAVPGTWHVTLVEGVRNGTGMAYTLTLERRDPATLDLASGSTPTGDFSCLDSFAIIEPEKRVSKPRSPADDSEVAAEPTVLPTEPGADN